MRTLGILFGIVLIIGGIIFAATGEHVAAVAVCAAASFLAAHRGRNDPEASSAKVRAITAIMANGVLVCGLALVVIFLLAWLFAPDTVQEIRSGWVVYLAFGLVLLQTLFLHHDPRFASTGGLRLIAIDALISATSIAAWLGAVYVLRIAPTEVLGRELVPADAFHLLLAGILLQMPILMLRRGVPSLLTFIESELPLTLERRGFARDAPIYYPVAATAVGVAVSTLLWLWMRPWLPGPLSHAAAGLILVTAVTALVFLLTAVFISRTETRTSLVAKRYDLEERRLLIITATSMTVVGILLIGIAWIALVGQLVIGGFPLGKREIRDIAVIAILVATGPIGFYMRARMKRLDQLEDRLPDLLSDLAESTRSGLTLSSAVMQARNNDYGVLNHDIDIMARQLSWGFSFAEAFRRFGERRKASPLVRRLVRLVVEAAHSGGNTAEVLAAAGRSTYELRAVEADRRSTMSTQMIVIYVIYGVFLLVITVLSEQFVPPLVGAAAKTGTSGLIFGGSPTLAQIRGAYVDAILVQAVGSGIVAGVLHESRWTAGLRHVFLMTLIAYIVARLAIL